MLFGRRQSLANLASVFADESTGWTFDRRGAITGWSDIWEPAGGDERPSSRGTGGPSSLSASGSRPDLAGMTLRSIGHRFTAYPYRIAGSFASSDPRLDRLWNIGLHTMRLCAHETFEDGPHYEQMQYAGDSMITSQLAMLTSGDYRLTRQELHHFDWSRLSDGLDPGPVSIPPGPDHSQLVAPLDHDGARLFPLLGGHARRARDLARASASVLDWFGRHTANGLPSALPYWNITDWCAWWPRGVVPGADTGPTTIISAQYIVALDEAAPDRPPPADMAGEAGPPRRRGARRCGSVRVHALMWSEAEGLYFDRPGGPEVSQYGNAWAVVAGIAGPRERARLAARFPLDPALAPGSFFCWHTVFAALRLCGRYDEMPSYLDLWHESADYGLSTFVEENSYWRSMCHAWSAHPVTEFLTGILGVMPTEPGFARVLIAPHLCGLDACSRQPGLHAARADRCRVARRGGALRAHDLDLPPGIEASVRAPNGTCASAEIFRADASRRTFPLA